jgi:subtilase family serine protease
MNDRTGGTRLLRRGGTLAVAVAVAVLTTGCGVVHVHFGSSGGSASTVPATYRAELAYAQCIRAHGLPGFPNPNPSGGHFQLNPNPNSPAARANDACKHLLTGGGTGTAATAPAPSPPGAVSADCLASRPPSCDTPRQLLVAYGIQPLLDRGITGRRQTIVLLEFPPASTAAGARVPVVSDIRQDLARFDSAFSLPAARLQVVNTLAHVASPWLAAAEEVGDTEIVHAVAPDAAIREVLIPSPYTARIGKVSPAVVAALRLGLTQGGVIELSAGVGEQCFTPAEVAQWNSVLQAAQRDRVTVVISTGDNGAGISPCPGGTTSVKGVDLPASGPLTLAVGGTSLQASRTTGAYMSETAWNTSQGAGGGGFSRLFPRPAYQDGIAGIGASRGVPDVAADADYRTGMAIAFSGGSHNYLYGGGGVSVAAPLWAAVIVLADQYAGRALGFVNPALYRIGRSAYYHQAFHDVTTGTNTVTFRTQTITGYQAAPGWDPVTGWGSPNARVLVPLLARYVSP